MPLNAGGQPGEAVDGGVERQEPFQDRGQQEQAAAGKPLSIEQHADIHAAAQARLPAGRHPRRCRGHRHFQQAVDDGPRLRGVAEIVELQDLPQCVGAFTGVGQGKVIERQVGDQAPIAAPPDRRAQRRRGWRDALDRLHRRRPGTEFQVRMAAAERQPAGQIPVEAPGFHRQRLFVPARRVEVEVDKRELDIGPRVTRPARRPRGVVEGRVGRALAGVLQRVERQEFALVAVLVGRDHLLDRVDFGRLRPPCVGHQPVFADRLGHLDRLRPQLKQIGDRRAPQSQAVHRNAALQIPRRFVEIEKDVHLVAGADQGLGLESGQIKEQELLRERKILGQQAVARERPRRIGEHAFVFGKADRLDGVGPQDHRFRVDCVLRQSHRNAIVVDQLIERKHLLGLAAQEEAKPIYTQVGQGFAIVQATHGDPQRRHRPWRPRVVRGDQRPAGQGHRIKGHRPQRRRITCPELAGLPAHRLALHLRPGGNHMGTVQIGHRREPDDRHGRDRPQVMRVEHAEQGVGQLGEIVLDLVPQARGQERKRLDQPPDMGVLNRIAGQAQAPRDAGVDFRKRRTFPPQEAQLAIVER